MIKAEIQLIRSLGEKKSRTEMGLFIAEGDKFIGELAVSELSVRKVYLTEDSTLDGGEFDRSTEVEWVSDKEMERLSQLKSANNSLALVEMPRQTLNVEDLDGRLTIVLDGVQNPGNLGTIIRLADWFGVRDVICSPNCADCFNPKVVQATMGAILRVRIHYTDLLPLLKSTKQPIYGAFLEGDNIYKRDLTPNGILVMGSEGQGVSAEVSALITERLYIPPYPADCVGSESLNVAIATSIICSEFRRR
ncbi:MAG: RNA methyltransferase [Rikenellaceae bacterium]